MRLVVPGMALHATARLGHAAFAAGNRPGHVLPAHGVPLQFRQPGGDGVEPRAAPHEIGITSKGRRQHPVPARRRQRNRFGQDVAKLLGQLRRQPLQGFDQGLGITQRAHAPAGSGQCRVDPPPLVAEFTPGERQGRTGTAQGLSCLVDAVVAGFAFTPQLGRRTGKLVECIGTQVAAQGLALGRGAHFRGLGHGRSLQQGTRPA